MTEQPDVAAALRAVSGAQGFNAWMGVDLHHAGDGRVELSIAVKPEITQHHGFVHGGVVTALADTASSWAAATVAGDVVTSTLSMQFLAPARGERVRAVASVLRSGRRLVSVETRVFAEGAGAGPVLCAVGLAAIAPVGKGA